MGFTRTNDRPNPKTAIIYFLLEGSVEIKGTRELVPRKGMIGEEGLERNGCYQDDIRALTDDVRILWILAQDHKTQFLHMKPENSKVFAADDALRKPGRARPTKDSQARERADKVESEAEKARQRKKMQRQGHMNERGNERGGHMNDPFEEEQEDDLGKNTEEEIKNEQAKKYPKHIISDIAYRLRQTADKTALTPGHPCVKLPPGSERAEENPMGALPKVLNARSAPRKFLPEQSRGFDVLDSRVDHVITSASAALGGNGMPIVDAAPDRLPPFARKLPALPSRALPLSARLPCTAAADTLRSAGTPPHTDRGLRKV